MAQIVALLFKIVRVVLYINVAFEPRPERSEEISHADIWRKNHPAIEF